MKRCLAMILAGALWWGVGDASAHVVNWPQSGRTNAGNRCHPSERLVDGGLGRGTGARMAPVVLRIQGGCQGLWSGTACAAGRKPPRYLRWLRQATRTTSCGRSSIPAARPTAGPATVCKQASSTPTALSRTGSAGGYYSSVAAVWARDAKTGRLLWIARTGSSPPQIWPCGAVTVSSGLVYLGVSGYNPDTATHLDGRVYAFGAGAGHLRWVAQRGGLNSKPVVANGYV